METVEIKCGDVVIDVLTVSEETMDIIHQYQDDGFTVRFLQLD